MHWPVIADSSTLTGHGDKAWTTGPLKPLYSFVERVPFNRHHLSILILSCQIRWCTGWIQGRRTVQDALGLLDGTMLTDFNSRDTGLLTLTSTSNWLAGHPHMTADSRTTVSSTVFDREQLYEIWSYNWSFIRCPTVSNHIYTLSNLLYSNIDLNITVRQYHSFGPVFLSMKPSSSSQYLTSAYDVWSCLENASEYFRTQQITATNDAYVNSLRLLLGIFC